MLFLDIGFAVQTVFLPKASQVVPIFYNKILLKPVTFSVLPFSIFRHGIHDRYWFYIAERIGFIPQLHITLYDLEIVFRPDRTNRNLTTSGKIPTTNKGQARCSSAMPGSKIARYIVTATLQF